MKINTRPLAVTFVLACALLFLILYLYHGAGSVMFLLGGCLSYGALGLFVGREWPANAWQVALIGSIPAWLLSAWRTYSARDLVNLELNLTLFMWLPIISLAGLYVGTYVSRWLAIRRRKQNAPGG